MIKSKLRIINKSKTVIVKTIVESIILLRDRSVDDVEVAINIQHDKRLLSTEIDY